jgi:hypothetical protein
MTEPGLGDVMVTATGGWGGKIIRWGEGKPWFTSPWLCWLFWLRHPAKVNHVGTYVGHQTFICNGRHYVDEPAVMEGRPTGAGLAPVADYPNARWLNLPIPDGQRQYVVLAALGMKGTRYGWLNCLCIGLGRLFDYDPPQWVRRILASRRWEECAQMADAVINDSAAVYEKNNPGHKGLRLFNDGRPEGLVSPDDIDEAWGAHAHVQA